MATSLSQAIGSILDNTADVIEGGNSWRGSGTAYYGIPGARSNDPDLRSGDDTPLTVAATAAITTSTFDVASSKSWDQARWVKTGAPGFWALCTTSGGSGSPNIDRARKITGYNNTTKVFSLGSALPAAPIANDVFAILQGFKRAPNQDALEHDATDSSDGLDRYFSLSAAAGEQLEYFGAGVATYKTEIELRLRILKFGREHDAVASAMENAAILRAGICHASSPDHRDGTYTRAILPTGGGAKVETDDKHKVVVVDSYTTIYRVSFEFK
jgi:hypothetical protein